jgi:hypothetical protein
MQLWAPVLALPADCVPASGRSSGPSQSMPEVETNVGEGKWETSQKLAQEASGTNEAEKRQARSLLLYIANQ